MLARFDRAGGPVDLTDVAEAMRAGAAEGEPELWKADRLAAEIRPFPGNPSPWGGYFGPRFSATYENGEVVDSPPLAAVDTRLLVSPPMPNMLSFLKSSVFSARLALRFSPKILR